MEAKIPVRAGLGLQSLPCNLSFGQNLPQQPAPLQRDSSEISSAQFQGKIIS